MRRIVTWFKDLTGVGKVVTLTIAALLSIGVANAAAQPAPSAIQTPTTGIAKPQPKVEKKIITATEAISYTSSTVEDQDLAQGVIETRIAGVNGAQSLTFEVTYTDGVETARVEKSKTIVSEPVNEVIAKGTKLPEPSRPQVQAQTSCQNGSYTNTYGNSVCRPYESSGVPAGASAQCEDGSYSFSQSRRGTCSGHGGVEQWL